MKIARSSLAVLKETDAEIEAGPNKHSQTSDCLTDSHTILETSSSASGTGKNVIHLL